MSNNDDRDHAAVPEIVVAAAFFYCLVIGGVMAYIIAGIYYMVSDRYLCSDSPDKDMLWLYAVLVLTVPVGFQYVLSCVVHQDSVFTRLTATGAVILGFIIYGAIVLFFDNVCDAQIANGGLYIWVWIQFPLSLFLFVVLMYVIANPSILDSLDVGTDSKSKADPLLSPQQQTEENNTYQTDGID